MKTIIINILLLFTIEYAIAGGDYGGGPRVVTLYKLDSPLALNDLKLSKDKNSVELTVAYRMVRTHIDPLLTEEENKKLRLGKTTFIKYNYDKSLFADDTIEILEKRKRFTIFKKKYKKLAKKYFEIERIKSVNKDASDFKHYEVRLR
ncbi:hypothetical protein [Halobacteriovorax sp. HLS]|uniref:hypothetical protein n=1 Tax=Halobacteriovorax sp. HLS TaxID=2234000 RepID=UPI000FDCA9DF|nr:hypothetical protein [Halobacteriovorax sp. HLS]